MLEFASNKIFLNKRGLRFEAYLITLHLLPFSTQSFRFIRVTLFGHFLSKIDDKLKILASLKNHCDSKNIALKLKSQNLLHKMALGVINYKDV